MALQEAAAPWKLLSSSGGIGERVDGNLTDEASSAAGELLARLLSLYQNYAVSSEGKPPSELIVPNGEEMQPGLCSLVPCESPGRRQ